MDGLVQERDNSIANALELLFCTNPLIYNTLLMFHNNFVPRDAL